MFSVHNDAHWRFQIVLPSMLANSSSKLSCSVCKMMLFMHWYVLHDPPKWCQHMFNVQILGLVVAVIIYYRRCESWRVKTVVWNQRLQMLLALSLVRAFVLVCCYLPLLAFACIRLLLLVFACVCLLLLAFDCFCLLLLAVACCRLRVSLAFAFAFAFAFAVASASAFTCLC